jgi:hypothetical protein
MIHVRPNIKGIEHKELVWASKWPHCTRCAVPVNPEELCDNLVVRFKFTLRERLAVLFGQDLFLWFSTNGQVPQWPTPYLTNPVHGRMDFSDGVSVVKTVPFTPQKFFAGTIAAWDRGDSVENPRSDMNMLAPDLEAELKKTVREKINEQAAEKSAQ